ncbi:MAG: hypothetical protein AB7T63_02710 [Planctomycetota bacterium]
MSPRPLRLALACALLLVGALRAAGAAEPVTAIPLHDTPATVMPPTGDGWKRRVEAPVVGQWSVTYTSADGLVVLQAIAFPRDGSPDDDQVALLRRAVDTMFRTLAVDGYGMPEVDTFRILGVPGAEGRIEALSNQHKVVGRARILTPSDTRYAFAWGVARADAPADLATVEAFVGSLTPLAPRLFTPVFRADREAEEELLVLEGEPPVLRRDLDATMRLVEEGLGVPLSAAWRERLESALRLELVRGPRKVRDAVRAAHEAFEAPDDPEAAPLGPEARTALGRGFYLDHLARRLEGDTSAAGFVEAWHGAEQVLVDDDGDLLRALHVDAALEMAAFLGSIAADAPRGVSPGERERLLPWWSERFHAADEVTRARWRTLPVIWQRLRHRFDTADDARRLAFRRDVLALVHGDDVAAELATTPTAAALLAFIGAHRPPGPEALARKMADVTAERLTTLVARLGDPTGEVPLGW